MSKQRSEEHILKELETYRKSGNLKDVPEIINTIRDYPEGKICNTAKLLLSDIKDDKITGILVEALHQSENTAICQQLVQVCWESGLDYSNHLSYFVDLFLTLDLFSALEVFTLIENTILNHDVNQDIKKEMAGKIKAIVLDLPEHNKNLGVDLIHILEDR